MNTIKNKHRWLLWSAGLFLLLVFLSQPGWAQTYKIHKDVLNGGIQGIISGGVYSIWSSMGQSVIGNMEGGGYVLMGGFWPAFTYFVAGDPTNDGIANVSDVVYLLNYLFIGGPPPVVRASGDVNCDGMINTADISYLINYLFVSGPAPAMCDP